MDEIAEKWVEVVGRGGEVEPVRVERVIDGFVELGHALDDIWRLGDESALEKAKLLFRERFFDRVVDV